MDERPSDSFRTASESLVISMQPSDPSARGTKQQRWEKAKNPANYAFFVFLLSIAVANPAKSGAMEDLNLANEVSSNLSAKDFDSALNNAVKIENNDLKSIWIANITGGLLNEGDIDKALTAATSIENQQLKDVWLANIVLKALEEANCSVAESAQSTISDPNLSKIYEMNVSLKC
jgi:hypothetical protein